MRFRFQHGHSESLETPHPAQLGIITATGIATITAMLGELLAIPIARFSLNALIFVNLLTAIGMRALRRRDAFVGLRE
jgi:hypothetical protein